MVATIRTNDSVNVLPVFEIRAVSVTKSCRNSCGKTGVRNTPIGRSDERKRENYHPLRRCVICDELVEADDPTCAVCGQPACGNHAYDMGCGLWYCMDCRNGKTHPCKVCGQPANWRCADCGQWFCKNDSTFTRLLGEETYIVWGYLCDKDLRWELAEETAKEVSLK